MQSFRNALERAISPYPSPYDARNFHDAMLRYVPNFLDASGYLSAPPLTANVWTTKPLLRNFLLDSGPATDTVVRKRIARSRNAALLLGLRIIAKPWLLLKNRKRVFFCYRMCHGFLYFETLGAGGCAAPAFTTGTGFDGRPTTASCLSISESSELLGC